LRRDSTTRIKSVLTTEGKEVTEKTGFHSVCSVTSVLNIVFQIWVSRRERRSYGKGEA